MGGEKAKEEREEKKRANGGQSGKFRENRR